MKSKLVPVLIFIFGMSAFLLAQSDTARVIGTITDPTGAVIPSATVTITDAATGRVLSTKTDTAGQYALSALPIGKYHLDVR